jgi:rhodanese-related sulfurtransferase
MELEISCIETRDRLSSDDPPLLVDCRERVEYQLVRLPDAWLLPMSEIAARLDELAAREQDHLIVYCHHGMRSAQVAAWLRGRGFAKAQSMAGGIDAWAVEIEPGMQRY